MHDAEKDFDSSGKGLNGFGNGFHAFGKGFHAFGNGFAAFGNGFAAFGKGFDTFRNGFHTFPKGFDTFKNGSHSPENGSHAIKKGFDTFENRSQAFSDRSIAIPDANIAKQSLLNSVLRRMNGRWFLAFSFLLLAVHEAHELAHAVAGRVVCGEWPVRDFNAWRLAGECASWWPTAAGPLFTYALLLLGAVLARKSAAGIALIFAANPFARIFTAVMGGGDEMVVAQRLAEQSERTLGLKLVVIAVVGAICGSALYVAWRAMAGVAWRGLWFVAAMVWPMALTGLALFVVGNRLLRAGWLAEPSLSGAPLLVVVVSGGAAVLATLTMRWFTPLSSPPLA